METTEEGETSGGAGGEGGAGAGGGSEGDASVCSKGKIIFHFHLHHREAWGSGERGGREEREGRGEVRRKVRAWEFIRG